MRCEHIRLKKNFPFGRKSTPVMFCKDCKIVIRRIDLSDLKKDKSRKKKK